MERGKLIAYLQNVYMPQNFSADPSQNGLQVEGKKNIKKIAFAVDACEKSIAEAVNWKADLLIVHHGLFWGKSLKIRGSHYKRVKYLINSEMNLYAQHLPMDAHETLGHNASILKRCDIPMKNAFGKYGDTYLGFWGSLGKSGIAPDDFQQHLNKSLDLNSTMHVHGSKPVRQIAVISGAGAGFGVVAEAKGLGIDTFITGEANHSVYREFEENDLHLILCGHYASERFGLFELKNHMKSQQWGEEFLFIDTPSPL